ncbi:hypothetical protein MHU86_21526 [Fragilaria crotonensis]|nr:hypothetical protein MHU86_21526 [Fragilaria crotonensis]
MDTIAEPAMHVHRLDGSTMKFVEHECGLYVYFPSNSSNNVGAYTLVSTVAEQKKLFSRRDIANADMARTLYRAIGRPSEAEFQRILDSGCIRNCPVTSLDAKRALTIYGPDIATLKGRPRAPVLHASPEFHCRGSTPSVLEHHRDVTLCVDFSLCKGTFSSTPSPATFSFARPTAYPETGLVVEWRPDHPVPDDEYDRDYVRPARVPTDPLAAGDFSSVDASELADLHADTAAHDVPPPVLTVPDQGAPMHQRQHDDDVAYDADAAEDRDAAHGADADDDDADYQSGADDDDYQYGAYGDEGRQDGIPEDDIEAEDAVDAEDDIDAHRGA